MADNDNSNTHSNKSQSLPPICNYFNKGTCKFGDRCKFIHDHHNRSSLNPTNNTGTTNVNTRGYIGRAYAVLNNNQQPTYQPILNNKNTSTNNHGRAFVNSLNMQNTSSWTPPGFYHSRLAHYTTQPHNTTPHHN